MKPRHAASALLTSLLLLGATAGCGGTTGAGEGDRTLTVLAAASLTESFDELATVFEGDHQGVDVVTGYDSSATLAAQVVEGAPGDVLATADPRTMRTAVDGEATAAEPVVFATNELVLVVPAGNPADIRAFADLDRADVSYVTCVESAPCGATAASLLDRNGIHAEPRSLEVDVKGVLGKVVLDEADAGLVYASDALSAGDAVRTLRIPGAGTSLNHYLVAPTTQSKNPGLAREWIDLVLSDRGQRVLGDAGFGPADG